MQMHIPVELLDLCQDAQWKYHRPILLTADPSTETPSITQLHSASASFEIPVDEPLYLLSQGNFSYGAVEFLPATYPDWSENDQGGLKGDREQKIRVEVNAKYRDPSVFDWARVCMIGRDDMEDGVQGTGVPPSSAGGEPTKDSILSQVAIMIWVRLIISIPSPSPLITLCFADARDQRRHTQRVSASLEYQGLCPSKARVSA